MARILIVDDDINICKDYSELFRECGHDSYWVTSARAALQELEQAQYDIILVDASIDSLVRRRSTLTDILIQDYPSIRRVAHTGSVEAVFDPLFREKYHAIASKPATLERLYEAMGIPKK